MESATYAPLVYHVIFRTKDPHGSIAPAPEEERYTQNRRNSFDSSMASVSRSMGCRTAFTPEPGALNLGAGRSTIERIAAEGRRNVSTANAARFSALHRETKKTKTTKKPYLFWIAATASGTL